MVQRREVFFRGRVQGVGFRYTTIQIAQQCAANDLEVTGFVRNLPDGRVHLIAEGSENALDVFLHRLVERMKECISDHQVEIQPARGEFAGFDLRH